MGGVEGAESRTKLNIGRLKGDTKFYFHFQNIFAFLYICICISCIMCISLVGSSAPTVEEMSKRPSAPLESLLLASSFP